MLYNLSVPAVIGRKTVPSEINLILKPHVDCRKKKPKNLRPFDLTFPYCQGEIPCDLKSFVLYVEFGTV